MSGFESDGSFYDAYYEECYPLSRFEGSYDSWVTYCMGGEL